MFDKNSPDMKMILRIAYITIFSTVFYFGANAQMSFFNKVKYTNGEYSSAVPAGHSFMVFSGEKKALNNRANLRVTRFDECRNVDWNRAYKTDNEKVGTGYPLVVTDLSYYSYILLKETEDDNNLLTLIKMNSDAEIEWSKTFGSEDFDLSNYDCNLLLSNNYRYLYIVANAKDKGTVVFSLDKNGEILSSKLIEGLNHGASVIDSENDLFIFSDSSDYAKVDIDDDQIDSLFWLKSLDSLKFDKVVNPVAINDLNSSIVTGVVNIKSEESDTSLYKLVKFNLDGKVIKQSEGYASADYETTHYNSLKVFNSDIFYMLKNKVLFFDANLRELTTPKVYEFSEQEYFVADASLELCDDNSLVMTGHCYAVKNDGSLDTLYPYLFASKTQPLDKSYIVEAEEENCLPDSTQQDSYDMPKITSKLKEETFEMDTVELEAEDVDFTFEKVYFEEEKCGKINMDKIENEYIICPYERISLAVDKLQCAKQEFEWSTGESGTPKIEDIHFQGDYHCTVTYCDTVKISKFKVIYDDEETCYEVLYPNALRPDSQNEDEKIFKAYQKNEENGLVEYDVFTMKIFNRWGEKVYETDNYSDSWDGTFRGDRLPPDVYLYYIHWEVNILKPNGELDKKFEETKEGQVVLLR